VRATTFHAFFIAIAWLPLAAPAAEPLDQFIDRVVAACGGLEAVQRLASMRQTGRVVSMMRGGAEGSVRRITGPSGRLRVEIVYPGEAPEIRVLDGAKGWRDGVEAAPPLIAAMKLQAARIMAPLLIHERRRAIRDLGVRAGPEGREARRLALALEPGLELVVDVDVGTALLASSHGVMTVPGMGEMQFAAVYGNYLRHDGVSVARREDQYAMGSYIGYTVLDDIAFGRQDPAAFRP